MGFNKTVVLPSFASDAVVDILGIYIEDEAGIYTTIDGGAATKEQYKEIENRELELRNNFKNSQYARDREYPPIGDQLDALFKAGAFPADMAAQIQAVKDANPKPTGE